MIQYILECIAFQLVFLIIYDLFLKRETFFQGYRLYLIGTYAISMILPWVKIEAMKTAVPEPFLGYSEFLWATNDIAITATAIEDSGFNISWEYALLFGGMILATVFFGYKLYQIFNLRLKGEIRHFKDFTQIIISNSSMAFSFFKSIFLGDKVIAKEHRNIVEHELVHIRQNHSYDLIFFELMRIIGWFNPLVYVYQSRVSDLHEFIADSCVAKTNRKEQYELLLSQIFQTQNISFINQFFKSSLIKKRIVMLQKKKSRKIYRLKYLLLMPIIATMLCYSSCKLDEKNVIIVSDIENLTPREELMVFDKLEQYSRDTEVWELFVKDANSSMKFTKSDNGSYLSGLNGEKIYAKLAIDSKLGEHKIDLYTAFLEEAKEDISTTVNMTERYNQLIIERQRLLRSSNEENPVIVNLDQQLKALENSIQGSKSKVENHDKEVPFALVDEVPVFPGCENDSDKRACFNTMMQEHIAKNFNYPKEAEENGIQGRVNIIFTISKDGVIKNLRLKGSDKILETEAERIIMRLPEMKSGLHENKNVDVIYSIPISFKLK